MENRDQVGEAPPTEPTLAELERALDHVETEYICADYIESTVRRDAERGRLAERRQQLRNLVGAAREKQKAELAAEIARFINERRLFDVTQTSDDLCIALFPTFPDATRGDVMAALRIIIDGDTQQMVEKLNGAATC